MKVSATSSQVSLVISIIWSNISSIKFSPIYTCLYISFSNFVFWVINSLLLRESPMLILIFMQEVLHTNVECPSNATDVILNGTYQACGGLIQRINLYVMYASACSPSDLSNCSTLYLNEQKTLGEVNLALPPGKNYPFVFYNDAVLGEDKQVKASFTLSYNQLVPI